MILAHNFLRCLILKTNPASKSSLNSALASAFVYCTVNKIKYNIVIYMEKKKGKDKMSRVPYATGLSADVIKQMQHYAIDHDMQIMDLIEQAVSAFVY